MKLKNMCIVLVACLAAFSCSKEGPARFKGNYSFKTSGYITAVRDSSDMFDTTYILRPRKDEGAISFYTDTVVRVYPDTARVSLVTESGQMDITETDADAGRMVITMNVTGGDLLVYYATAEGSALTLDPSKRFISTAGSLYSVIRGTESITEDRGISSDVTVSGTAARYDNIILFDLRYEGWFMDGNVKYDIIDSKVDCRAKLNE